MEIPFAPISANPDVLKLYHKQKSEFHFQQKSDNEFLVFLLDVAMKVITFVDQLKPNLLDACADDSADKPTDNNNSSMRSKKSSEMENSHIVTAPKVTPVEEDKRHSLSGERPAKIQKQSFAGLPPFTNYTDKSFQRQSEILQRQHEIISRQVESFPFPVPDNVIKPTFVTKDGARRSKLKSSSQGSPMSNSNTSDGEKTMDGEENNDKDETSMDVSSAPSTPLPREYRSRSEASVPSGNTYLPTSVSRHLPIPTAERQQPLEFHNLSPSKLRDHGLLEQKARVLDISKLGSNTMPSMAYMFSDKLATSAENTSDNLTQRSHHNIGTMQWASEYKFDGSALHIMNGRNSRKPRTVFTWEQLKQMEETFKQKKYLCTEDRMILAQKLDLTDEQIKVWFQNRRQKWKKGGSKDDEVIEYSQYYDLFSRDGSQMQHPQHENDSRDENNQRSINIPDHLRMKSEPIQCLSNIQQEQQNRSLSEKEDRSAALELKSQVRIDNEERNIIREQQMRIAADESRSPGPRPDEMTESTVE